MDKCSVVPRGQVMGPFVLVGGKLLAEVCGWFVGGLGAPPLPVPGVGLMVRGVPCTKAPAQHILAGMGWVGGNLVPCKRRSCFCSGALSAALTLGDCKLFSFEMELGIRMEGTDSSIFQKFIVPD